MIARFGNAPEPALREQVAMALVNKGARLTQLDRSEEAIAAYEESDDSVRQRLRARVARAGRHGASQQGHYVRPLESSEDEIEAYDQVIARFSNASEPALREQVVKALAYKRETLGRPSARRKRRTGPIISDDSGLRTL